LITRKPTHGTVTVNPIDLHVIDRVGGPVDPSESSVTYTSNGDEASTDSFSYRAFDLEGALSNEVTVMITIVPPSAG